MVEVPIRMFLAGADEPKPAQFLGLTLLRPEIPPSWARLCQRAQQREQV